MSLLPQPLFNGAASMKRTVPWIIIITCCFQPPKYCANICEAIGQTSTPE